MYHPASDQDWTEVVLKKKPDPKKIETQVKSSQNVASVSQATNKPSWKIEKQIDGDSGKPLNFVSKEDAKQIIQGRVAMKLSQADLAKRLNMPLAAIQEIESCKAVENKLTLSKIKRFLKI